MSHSTDTTEAYDIRHGAEASQDRFGREPQNPVHLYHPACQSTPPALGDTMTALCGHQQHYLGQREVAPGTRHECGDCRTREHAVLTTGVCPNCSDAPRA